MVDYVLRPALESDVDDIAELRAVVLRDDLARLGRYDECRVRDRFRGGYVPANTTIIEVAGEVVGAVAVRPGEGYSWLEHFYLAPALQGMGIGSAVVKTLLRAADTAGTTMRLNVLQGSRAQNLYLRCGFVVESQDPIDVFMVREPRRTD